MDSLSSVSPSIILPPTTAANNLRPRGRHLPLPPRCRSFCLSSSDLIRRPLRLSCKSSAAGGTSDPQDGDEDSDVNESEQADRALNLDGSIPSTSDEFVKRVSSRAYDMRRHLQQTFDSSSYDVLEANPWREKTKPVYVLTQRENQLCTMKTRMNRSEVESELGKLFSKRGGGKWNQAKQQPRNGNKFQMLVEDIRDGVLVFEDANEAVKYCDLLQGGGRGCEGVAEIDASSVFALCQKMRALAVLFRRGRKPPLPQSLEQNLRAKKRSLEDQQD